MMDWLNALNTTNFRILVSVVFAAVWGTMILIAVMFFGWNPTDMQLKVLLGLMAGLLTMMGFDVIQFASKRFSDSGYAKAKNPPQTTQVSTGSTEITVKPDNG